MRRPRTVAVQVRERVMPRLGIVAALVAAIAAGQAACTPKTETPGTSAPSASQGGSTGTGGSSAATSGGSNGGGVSGSGSGGTTDTSGGSGGSATPTGGAGSGPMGGTGGATSTADAASGGGDTGAGGASGGPKFTGSTIAKIMVLGSSNETRTCWRAFLWQKLRAAGVMNFDYVGRTVVGPDCGVMGYDKDVEAAPGTIITGFSAGDFATRYKANPPDIVLVHVGGADAREGIAISKILDAYTLAVEQARLVNPHVAFLVGAHTPQQPMTGILELNAAIPIWAAKISTPDSPVGSVDLFTGIVSATDLSDGTHLNEAGSTKVADRFLAPLLPFFKP
jgi:hypothetical protein